MSSNTHPLSTWLPGLVAVLTVACLALGSLPWNRPGTPWRPARPQLEAAARAQWDGAQIAKGRDYRSAGYGRFFLRRGVSGLLYLAAIGFGWHLALRKLPFGATVAGVTLALLVLLFILQLIDLPFGLAALNNARKFGLSRQSVGSWLWDLLRSFGLSLLISALVGGVLFALMQRWPRVWPVPATILGGVGGVILTLLVPLVVDPIFNHFAPLTDRQLAGSFLDLARRGGVPAREVLVSDASRRTTALNAYFTGFGPTRRIVVYDTLVNTLPRRESELVVAHEVGHWARHHITRGLVMGTLGLLAGLWLARAVLTPVFRHRLFGLSSPLDPAAVPLYLMLFWVGNLVSLPIENAISRGMEREADLFALNLTGDATTQIAVERSLGITNLADVVPPPLVESVLFTHPGTLDRIAQAEAWRMAHRDAGNAGSPAGPPAGADSVGVALPAGGGVR